VSRRGRSRAGRRAVAVAYAFVCAIASWATPSRADDVSDLLRRGVALRRERRNEEALAAFQEAARLAPTPPVVAQLALAEQALGHWPDAARDLDAALASPSDPWIAKNLDALRAAQSVVAAHVAWIAIDVEPADAQIRLDGRALAAGGVTPVGTGPGVIEVRADARVPDVRRVDLAPGERLHLVISLAQAPAPPGPAAATPLPAADAQLVPAAPVAPGVLVVASSATASNQGTRGPPIVPIVLGAAGIAALATGTYFGVRTFSEKAMRDTLCVGGCVPEAATHDADARTSATASTVSFAVGGALVVAAGAWWLLDRRRAPTSGPASIRLAPMIAGGTAGLVAQGSM
jgi:hypothetical protein